MGIANEWGRKKNGTSEMILNLIWFAIDSMGNIVANKKKKNYNNSFQQYET